MRNQWIIRASGLLIKFLYVAMKILVQLLIVLWMTRSITDDIPGWGALFNGRAGDGTVSVSLRISLCVNELIYLTDRASKEL